MLQILFISSTFLFCLQIASASTPCCDFFVRSKFGVAFDEVEVEPPKPALIPDEPPPDPEEDRVAPLKAALQAHLTLIVLWNVSSLSGLT